jgi:pimeloyl-ACP methyl ester carboxylesterase
MASVPNAVAATRPAADADASGVFVAGAGEPVVLLHASLGSKSQWTPLALRLASRYRVIAVDLCGYGDNTAPQSSSSDFTLDDEASFVSRRLDGLVGARARVHFIGHSYGALVALRLASRQTDRVASLTLYEPVAFRMLDSDDETRAHAERLSERVGALVASGQRHEAARIFVDFWSGPGTFASAALPVQAALARRVEKVPFDFSAAMSWPLDPDDVRAIVVPTLLFVGNRSPAIMQRVHALLAHTLPRRRVAAVDCGHMGPMTHAHWVNPWIDAFVDLCADRTAR